MASLSSAKSSEAVIDYHLHLWPHGQTSRQATVEELAAFCEKAALQGVDEIAVTEHLFRFTQADRVLGGFWSSCDDAPALKESMADYWAEHARADLDQYVETVLQARASGLPIVLGLEVDYYRDRMSEVGELLSGYPFDVLLGSVHWLGSWMFDNLDHEGSMAEWALRAVEAVWDDYVTSLEELCDSGACDVAAHPDLVKVCGHFPPGEALEELNDRIAEAISNSGMAAEVSSAGWFKPVAEQYPSVSLLSKLSARGVPVTTASDGHGLDRVSVRVSDLKPLLAAAGYKELTAFRARKPTKVPM